MLRWHEHLCCGDWPRSPSCRWYSSNPKTTTTSTLLCSDINLENYNYPISGNTVQFQFQIRSDCKHYFKISSPCTRYEAEYTTTHDWVGSPSYTIDAVSLPWVNLITCTSGLAAILEGNVVYHFYPPPKSGWYHIFLTPAPAKLNGRLCGHLGLWASKSLVFMIQY